MHASPSADLVVLYHAAAICQTFPAYTVGAALALHGQELIDVLRAVELLETVRAAHAPA